MFRDRYQGACRKGEKEIEHFKNDAFITKM